MQLRLCHPHSYKQVFEYNEETRQFTGAVGQDMNDYLEYLQRGFDRLEKNVTLIVQPHFGIGVPNEETGIYDGCIGRLQSNQSDIILQMFKYPMDISGLSQGFIAYETQLVLGGNYEPIVQGDVTQTLDSFKSFTVGVWSACVLSVAIIYALSSVKAHLKHLRRQKTSRKNEYQLYDSLTHCLRLGRMESRGFTNKSLFICASIFSLLIVHYFSSFIKTQLVVIPDSEVFYTYADIIRRNATPQFIKGMAYDVMFKEKGAPESRKKLWEWAVKVFGEEKLYIDMDPILFMIAAMKMIQQKSVIMMDSVLMNLLPGTGCPLAMRDPKKIRESIDLLSNVESVRPLLGTLDLEKEQQEYILTYMKANPIKFDRIPGFFFYISREPSEKKFAQGVLLSAQSNERLVNSFEKVFRTAVETGYTEHAQTLTEGSSLLGGHPMMPLLFGQPLKGKRRLYDDCISPVVIKPEVHYHSLVLDNMTLLIYVSLGLCLIAFLCLLIELLNVKLNESRKAARMGKLSHKGVFAQKYSR